MQLALVLEVAPRACALSSSLSSLDRSAFSVCLAPSGTFACLAGPVLAVRRQAKTTGFESLVELVGCWTQTCRYVFSVFAARAKARVPCFLSALPPEACSVANARVESGLTTVRQCLLQVLEQHRGCCQLVAWSALLLRLALPCSFQTLLRHCSRSACDRLLVENLAARILERF